MENIGLPVTFFYKHRLKCVYTNMEDNSAYIIHTIKKTFWDDNDYEFLKNDILIDLEKNKFVVVVLDGAQKEEFFEYLKKELVDQINVSSSEFDLSRKELKCVDKVYLKPDCEFIKYAYYINEGTLEKHNLDDKELSFDFRKHILN